MMNNNIHIHQYDHQEVLIEALAEAIIVNLQSAIETRGYAVMFVSGGSTPKPLFHALCQKSLAWEKVRVGLCDERWVNKEHPDSNENLVRTHLLQSNASKAEFIGLYFDKISSDDAEELCTQRVKKLLWPIDVVILGMGEDGHTASLFPHNPKLLEALDLTSENLCIAITPQSAPHPRMSLTLSALLCAEHLYLHFEGESKRSVFESALGGEDVLEFPIRAVLHQEKRDIEVYYG